MKHPLRSRVLSLLALGLVTTGLAATVGQSNDDRIDARTRARAHRIFEYDRKHAGQLPGNRLYALSIAVRFGDQVGAENLVNALEPLVR